MKENINETRKEYWLYSGIEATSGISQSVTSYLNVFLQGIGMPSFQVGLVNSLTSAVAIIAGPFWGTISDRIHSVRKVLLICLAVGALFWALIPGASRIGINPLLPMLLIVPIGNFCRAPGNSLKDSLVVMNANTHRLNYGAVRMWGSIVYAIVSLILGVAVPYTGVEFTFYFYAAAIVPLLALVWVAREKDTKQKRIPLKEMHFGALFNDYYFVTFLIFIMLLYVSISTTVSFIPYLIADFGGDSSKLGLLLGVKGMMEVPSLIVMKKVRQRFPLPVIVSVTAVLYMAAAYLYAGADSMLELTLIAIFNGLGGGVLIGSATNYVYLLAPKNLKSTAQTLYASVTALASIAGNLIAGYLIDTVGVRQFYIISGTILLGAFLIFVASFPFGTRVLKKKMPADGEERII